MQRIAFGIAAMILAADLNAQQNADCISAMDVCKKQTYTIQKASGEGRDNQEADFVACFMNGENFGQAEENSTWIKFEVAESGSLAFTITPTVPDDDMDFVVYKLPDNGDCKLKQIVRCMASGDTTRRSACMGSTGLRANETDTSEDAGCTDAGDNAWLAPLKVQKGEKYVILVSNVTAAGHGFTINLNGSAKLPCDEDPKPVAAATPPPVVKKPKAPAPPVPSPQPQQIGGRKVEVGETVKVKNRTLKMRIWDSQVEDGDIVSVYLGDKKVIDHLYLRIKPQEFEIELPAGREHYLTVYADDFGKAEPNTAIVQIFDGVREYTIDLVADRKKQESLKIVVD